MGQIGSTASMYAEEADQGEPYAEERQSKPGATPGSVKLQVTPASPASVAIKPVQPCQIPTTYSAKQWFKGGIQYFYLRVDQLVNGSGQTALLEYCNQTACPVMMVGKYKVVSPADRKFKPGPQYMKDTLAVVSQDLRALDAEKDDEVVKKSASKALQRLFRAYVHLLLKHAHEPRLVTDQVQADFGLLVLFSLGFELMEGSNKEMQLVGSYVNQAIETYPQPQDVVKLCENAFKARRSD
eukprot:g19753.t1